MLVHGLNESTNQAQDIKVTGGGAAHVLSRGTQIRETQVGNDETLTWANSAAANTQVTVTVVKPSMPVSEYKLKVYNPSTVTDLTCKVFAVAVGLGGGDRDCLVTAFSIPKSQAMTGTTINAHARLLHGIFDGSALKLVFSNDTVLGGGDGFSAYMRLREVQ